MQTSNTFIPISKLPSDPVFLVRRTRSTKGRKARKHKERQQVREIVEKIRKNIGRCRENRVWRF
eukprot:851508-Amorphochlora_amoeboformis.AAC.1